MWKKPRLGVRVGEPGGAHLRLGWVMLSLLLLHMSVLKIVPEGPEYYNFHSESLNQAWGTADSGAFGTHQGVAPARVPQLHPLLLACSQGV